MSKEAKNPVGPAADTSAAPVAQAEVRMNLDGFCARLSETVKRPELIGSFHHSEKVNGNLVGTASEFQRRYDAFVNKPV